MKLNIESIYNFILAFFITITATSVFYVNNLSKLSVLATAFFMLILFHQLFKKNQLKFKTKYFLFIILYFIFAVIYIIFKNNNSMGCFNVLLCCIPGFFVYMIILKPQEGNNSFFNYIIIISAFLGVVSVFCWFFTRIYPVLHPSDIIHLKWGIGYNIESYYNIYFSAQPGRNCSIFAEAPAANYFFSTALLLNEFYVKYQKKIVNSILIVTILTTLSTTGAIVIALFIFYKIGSIKLTGIATVLFKYMMLLLTLIIGVIFIKILINNKLDSISGEVRSYMIMREWEAFAEKPLLGHGFAAYTEGSSNSITALLADGGIVLWGIYYIPIFGIIIYDIFRHKRINYFVVIYAAMFAISVFQYTMMATMMTALLWITFLNRIGFERQSFLNIQKGMIDFNVNMEYTYL